jgi:hypothetical protein
MQDGYPMIAEVHQEELCKPSHVIISQANEAERMIGTLNKNLPPFLHYMLLEANFPEEFVKKLIKESCKASLVAEISSCKWDGKTRTLTTVADEKHEEGLKAFEGAVRSRMNLGTSRKGPNLSLVLPQRTFSTLTALTQLRLFLIAIKHPF